MTDAKTFRYINILQCSFIQYLFYLKENQTNKRKIICFWPDAYAYQMRGIRTIKYRFTAVTAL